MLVESAILYPSGKIYKGKRHNNCFEKARMNFESNKSHEIQGFMTDTGVFLDREKALIHARIVGQIKHDQELLGSELTSEDLW